MSEQTESKPAFKWPKGARAAVCLTYDDGLYEHLDTAIPALDAVDLKGSFYCPGHSSTLDNRIDDWRAAVANGHELGNHTLYHPCAKYPADGQEREWVHDYNNLGAYSLEQIDMELTVANRLLKAIDGKDERTLAYTCCESVAGGESFVPIVQELFVGARDIGDIPDSMEGYDIFLAPSTAIDGETAEEMIAWVEEARKKGTILVIMFHSVGGSYLNVDPEEHKKLLEYLAANREEIWTDTFLNVMKYIRDNK